MAVDILGERKRKKNAELPEHRRSTYRDPDMLELSKLLAEDTRPYSEITKEFGVVYATMKNWSEEGETKRPQAATMRAIAKTLGYDFKLVPVSKRSKGNGSNA